ncbi:MAG: septum formation initiator family protein [Paraprevotella sp.]|nr:septum formation initiator family protein [Paraprevotella sp.]MBP3471122.1 septum formation initiator family protein [Paraprevotella sp.]
MGKLNSMWNMIRRYKYLFVVTVFVLLVGVLDENSFWNRYRHQATIRELNSEIRMYTERYEHDTQRLQELEKDPEAIKKIARERYFMKMDDEDVFVFTEGEEE